MCVNRYVFVEEIDWDAYQGRRSRQRFWHRIEQETGRSYLWSLLDIPLLNGYRWDWTDPDKYHWKNHSSCIWNRINIAQTEDNRGEKQCETSDQRNPTRALPDSIRQVVLLCLICWCFPYSYRHLTPLSMICLRMRVCVCANVLFQSLFSLLSNCAD